MKKMHFALFAVALATTAVGCAPPNKILVGQTFIGEDRSIKILMTKPGEGGDKGQFVDQYVRVCTLKDGQEVDCKDTLVLENVAPGSLY